MFNIFNYLIFTAPSGRRICTIYSPNGINGTMMDIPSGTQNVILYCICRRNDVAVGPTTWFINGSEITHTTASGNNPYYRDNVPSSLTIPLFNATHAGTYGCASFTNTPSVTIDLAISGKSRLMIVSCEAKKKQVICNNYM